MSNFSLGPIDTFSVLSSKIRNELLKPIQLKIKSYTIKILNKFSLPDVSERSHRIG